MILPGATLGLLGGGQLGRMFTAEARRMGYNVMVVDPDPYAPAAQLTDLHLQVPWTDPSVPQRLIESCAAVTTEFENVPADVLNEIAKQIPVRPSGKAVAITQDRIREKQFLNDAGIATAAWVEITDGIDLAFAWDAIGGQSGILKTAQLGYDGKGQVVVNSLAELRAARERITVRCILEQRVSLKLEISVMVCRGADGALGTWHVGENVHRDGILYTTLVPARISEALSHSAIEQAAKIVMGLEYVGVMGVECFVTTDDKLLINELAPRPHNSGHWTLDAPVTSQFEQQVRILAGLPLGATWGTSTMKDFHIAMINILGDVWPSEGQPDWAAALALPGTKLHLYGKREARPGRKMGHLTAISFEAERALATVTEAWHLLHKEGENSRKWR